MLLDQKSIEAILDLLMQSPKNQGEEITSGFIDRALERTKGIADLKEKELVIKQIGQELVKRGWVDLGIKVANKIRNSEARAYALSSMVLFLIESRREQQAISLSRTIEEQPYREDAYSYIIKEYLNSKEYGKAEKFTSEIPDNYERQRAAKILLSSAMADKDNGRVEAICKTFDIQTA